MRTEEQGIIINSLVIVAVFLKINRAQNANAACPVRITPKGAFNENNNY
ncbi:MAG: hypothetical protein ACR2PV_06150 [Gammaproteobacteria bacterium]